MTLADDFRKEAPTGDKKIHEAIEVLEGAGFRITKDAPRENASVSLLHEWASKPGATVRIGVVSDTHLGSRAQQITALTDFYRYADSRGVQAYVHCGDLVDGLHVHRDAVYSQFVHGFDAQVKYAAEAYPRSQNGPTYWVEGNHDNWTFENAGASIGEWLPDRRPDLVYLGYYSAFVDIGAFRMYLAHGARGGGAYAKSYKPQKLIEQMDPLERSGVHAAFFGHWHYDDYIGRYQGVYGFAVPSFQRKTRFLKSIGKGPTIGGIVLEIEYTSDRRVWNIRQDWQDYEPLQDDHPGI